MGSKDGWANRETSSIAIKAQHGMTQIFTETALAVVGRLSFRPLHVPTHTHTKPQPLLPSATPNVHMLSNR